LVNMVFAPRLRRYDSFRHRGALTSSLSPVYDIRGVKNNQ